ncbi:MAG: YncE family protein [Candidatus Eremiobacteraeota bacterium]|nr:YncE family protein [Candidatus Eremiobacteraeota bacterium]
MRFQKHLFIAISFLLLSTCLSGCSGIKGYFEKSPININIKKKKLILEKEVDIKIPGNPWGISIDTEKARAYVVCNSGNYVAVVDLSGKKILHKIDVGSGPWESAFDRRRNRLYVTNGDNGSISIIDLETKKETMEVKTGGQLPFDVAYGENRDEIYVANSDSDSLSIIDGEKLELKKEVKVGDYPYSVAVDEISRRVFVSNNFDGTLSIVDPEKGLQEKNVGPLGSLSGITIENLKQQIYIAGTGANRILVYRDTDMKLSDIKQTPERPIDVCVDEKYGYIYAIHREKGILTVYSPDHKKYAATARVKVGEEPVRVVVDPVHSLIITVNNKSNSISLIRYRLESGK